MLIKKVGIKKTEDKEIDIKHIWRLKTGFGKDFCRTPAGILRHCLRFIETCRNRQR